jgi:nuclear cap-binding protein subunit 1
VLTEDDEFNQQPYRNQHHRREAPPGSRLKRGLLDIGEDDRRRAQDEAFHWAKLATDNYEDEYVRDTFTTVILKMVVEQAFKIPFVAAVVLYAHQEKKELAADVVAKAGAQLQDFLEKGQWKEVKLMLRFLACLSRLYEEDGVLPIMDELFNRAADLQTASQDDVLGIELVKIILLTIPYLLAFASDTSLQAKVAELLERTEIVASAQPSLEPLVDPYPAMSEGNERPMACASIISLLQRQLQDEAANSWPLACIPRLFDPSLKTTAVNGDANGETNGDNSNSANVQFPAINVPSPVNTGSKTLFPDLFFSLFADQEIESVPPTSNIASILMRDATVDIINSLNFNRNHTARFLSQINRFWAANAFAPAGTAFDKLSSIAADGQSTWKPEDVAIDAIFSQIFTLPAPEHRLVYYHSLITESCRISPGAIAPSLGRAIRFLFRAVDVMDLELAYRYMDWFAHHLSNFEFRWKWAEWYVLLIRIGPSCMLTAGPGSLRRPNQICNPRKLSSMAQSTRRFVCLSPSAFVRRYQKNSAISFQQARRKIFRTSSSPMSKLHLPKKGVKFSACSRRRRQRKKSRRYLIPSTSKLAQLVSRIRSLAVPIST